MTTPDVTRQAGRLAGEIVQDIYDDWWAKAAFRYDGTNYELLSNEDCSALGFPEDDPFLTILRRKSDGQLFGIGIGVTALPVAPPTPPSQVIPGQLALPEVSP